MNCWHSLLMGWMTGVWLSIPYVAPAQAALAVEGVADKQVYTDTVALRVPTEAGYTYSAALNDQPFPLNKPVTLSQPDYYELLVQRTPVNGTGESRLVRFLVVAGERLGTEWGLPPHVPSPLISSASSEFAGAQLRLLMPSHLPLGLELPVVAWVEDQEGHAVRVNGLLTEDELPGFWIRRGVGSGLLTISGPARSLPFRAHVGGLAQERAVVLEDSPNWLTVSGLLASQVEWGAGARVHVTRSLTVPAGGSLTIGAGAIVKLDAGVDITNNGRVLILGSRSEPVLFLPSVPGKAWGGFVMRSGTGEIDGTGVVFAGSGADSSWFSRAGNPGSHRREQALFFVNDNQRIHLTDAAAISLAGQLGHAVKGGRFELNHFLMQRATSGGEFTGASFRVNDSAFVECPDDSSSFVDGDNDALYLVSGDHGFTNTLFGWTKDDGVDSGGSGVGKLAYQSCWFEATFHEGNSLSGAKDVIARDTVYIDCGQGLEDGYDAPVGVAEHCLFLANQVGVRHGDNYPNIGRYDGRITATGSLILNNHRDVFGFNWRSTGWTNATGQMGIRDNWLSRPNPYFPDNRIWNPSRDASQLAAFGARDRVGAGIATRGELALAREVASGVPIRLSMVCTKEVVVRYVWEIAGQAGVSGSLALSPGEVQGFLPIPDGFSGLGRASIVGLDEADLTGRGQVLVQRSPTRVAQSLVARGAVWRYRDDAQDLGQSWHQSDYPDSAWPQGPTPMGYGDGPEGTTLRASDSGPEPRPLTYYFRTRFAAEVLPEVGLLSFAVRRDDGVVVYLNGEPMFRMNMPDVAEVKYQTLASVSTPDETSYFPTNVSAQFLRAGTNVLAVELHQSSQTSGDAHFDLELQALPAEPPVRLESVLWGVDGFLFWDAATAVLKEAEALPGPWKTVPSARSPYRLPGGVTRFYRLE